MSKHSIPLALMVCAMAAGATQAQERVYRCGSSYSQQPCATALVVDVDDARSDAQRRAAMQVAARDQQTADTLARERRQRDAAAGRQGAAHIGPPRAASAPEKTVRTKSPRKPDGRRTHEDARMSPPLRVITPAG
jgi:hypothetical protein